jgi:hypothetical protein
VCRARDLAVASRRLPPLDIGQQFGDWTVIAQLENAEQPKVGYSRVLCACGTEKDMINNRLRAGKSSGCGCRRGRRLAMSGVTHGKSNTPLYKLWASIKHRLKSDLNYVTLGTKLYEPWEHDFEAFETFILSLGPKPTPQHTLDRIEPTGDYEPNNLRWADKTVQSQNRRNNMFRNLDANSRVVVGHKYHMLTVLELVVRRKHDRNWYGASVRCDCGTVKTVYQTQLLSGRTTSCGCRRRSNTKLGPAALEKPLTANGETHSLSEWARRTGLSKNLIWNRIHKLGWNPTRAVTDAASVAETVTIDGETKSVQEWCRINGVSYEAAHHRIHRNGWDPIRAVTQPVGRMGRPRVQH